MVQAVAGRWVPGFRWLRPPRGVLFLLAGLCVAAVCPVQAGPLSAQAQISGRALDGAGRLLGGVEVLLAAKETAGHPLKGWTDPLGRFLFRHLPPREEYLLVATKPGYLASVVRITALPATGIDLFLSRLTETAGADMSWVLRLPGRDLLRDLRNDLVTADPFIRRTGRPMGGPVRAAVEQRMGGSTAGGGLGAGRDLGTRVDVAGPVTSHVLWASAAHFQSRRLGEEGGGGFREDMDMGVSADLQMGEDARDLLAGFRFKTRDVNFGTAAGRAENRALGLDLDSHLKGEGTPQISFHLRDLASRQMDAAGGWRTAGTQGLGLTVAQTFNPGDHYQLETAVTMRDFSGGDDHQRVVPVEGAGRPGENAWLIPRGDWVVFSFRHRQTSSRGLEFSYGTDLQRTGVDGVAWIPAVDLAWRPVPRTRLATRLQYRWGQNRDFESGAGVNPTPLSASLSVHQELTEHTSFTLGLRQLRLSLLDPFAGDDWSEGESFHGVWTDGAARSREVRVSLAQELGPVVGHLSFLSGEISGRLAVPDPFELGAVPFRLGSARFQMVRALAVVPGSRTEISMAIRDLVSDQVGETFRVVGFRFSQGVRVPLRVRGQWRILVDYEAIDGGHPFAPVAGNSALPVEAASTSVARVSGGVAVRF